MGKVVIEVTPQQALENAIRQAIEASMQAEINTNADKLNGLNARYTEAENRIAEAEAQIKLHQATVSFYRSELKTIETERKPLRGDREVIDQRVAMAIAAATGQPLPGRKASGGKKASGGGKSGSAKNLDYQVMIDGQIRSFPSLTHLTYWLGKKGNKVGVDDLRAAFERDNKGTRLFSAEHVGLMTFSINGYQVGIEVTARHDDTKATEETAAAE